MRKPQMIQQCAYVRRHGRAVVCAWVIEFGGLPMAAVVQRDDASPSAGKRRHPAGVNPVNLLVGGKSVDEDDRRPLAFVEKGYLDIIVGKTRHPDLLLYPPAE